LPSSNDSASDWLYSRNSSPSSMPSSALPTSFSTRSGSMPVRSKNSESVAVRSVMDGNSGQAYVKHTKE